ncbi:MAG TPA: hypothetical protein VL221_05810 [Bacteroidota bacterium]|nr:hypothetical protein [Bacteroidota bacterium]
MPGEFRAVYVSHRRVFIGSRIRRTRELFALDCRFMYLHGRRTFTVRIHKDNPVLKNLQPRNVYTFYPMGGVGFKVVRDVVTDMADGSFYHIGKAVAL